MTIGFILRLHKLGYYSLFSTDDGITAIVIKNIVNSGYSFLPGEKLYLKELLFSYPTAWLCKIFGVNEFTLRILNIPFSVGLILLVYLLGKELCSKKVGLLSSAIITFATWELEFTRYVRSYILLQFLFILSSYLFFKAFVKEEKISKILLFSLFILTIFSSFLGIISLLTFFSLWLIKPKKLFKKVTFIFISLLILFSLIWLRIYSLFIDRIALSFTPYVDRAEFDYAGQSYSFFSMLKNTYLPQFKILSHLATNHHILWYLILFFYLIACLYFLRDFLFYSRETEQRYQYLLPLALSTLILFDLPELGILLFSVYSIVTKSKIENFKKKPIIVSLLILIIGILGWFFYGLFFWKGATLSQIKDVRLLYDVAKELNLFKFPSFVYYLYLAIPFPKMSFIVAMGLLILYLKSIKNENREKALYLSSLFIGAILFLPFPVRHSLPRYNFPIYPFFIIIYSFTVIETSGWLSNLAKLSKLYKNLIRAFLATIFLLFTLEHATPLEAYRVVNIAYGEPVIEPYLATSHHLTHYFDEKSAAEYVKTHKHKDDIIIVYERVVQYYYLGKFDYRLCFSEELNLPIHQEIIEGGRGDIYTNCGGAIRTARALTEFISKNIKQNKVIWLVVHNYSRLKSPQRKFVVELRDIYYKDLYVFLRKHANFLTFVAKDNLTEVYRFTP